MRSLSRAALVGTVAALALPAAASAVPATLSMTANPAKRGTLTLGAPTTFKVAFASPTRAATTDGNLKLQAIVTKLPDQLVFNPMPFGMCDVDQFVATKTCPSATKMGEAKIVADAGPEVGSVDATATLWFGTGYSVLARVQASRPAPIDEAIIGSLQTSSAKGDPSHGFGLALSLPVGPTIQQPLPGVYPVVKSFDATVTPPTKKVKVDSSADLDRIAEAIVAAGYPVTAKSA